MCAGGDIDGEIGGNLLHKSKKRAHKQLHGLPSLRWWLRDGVFFRGIADKADRRVHGLTGRSTTKT